MALFWDRFLRRSEHCHHAITGELKGPEVSTSGHQLLQVWFWGAFFAMTERVEHEFYAVRNAQFVVNAQQRLLHRVLFEVQVTRDFAVVQTLGDQMDGLFLARSKHNLAVS